MCAVVPMWWIANPEYTKWIWILLFLIFFFYSVLLTFTRQLNKTTKGKLQCNKKRSIHLWMCWCELDKRRKWETSEKCQWPFIVYGEMLLHYVHTTYIPFQCTDALNLINSFMLYRNPLDWISKRMGNKGMQYEYIAHYFFFFVSHLEISACSCW